MGTLQGHTSCVTSCAFDPTRGIHIVSGGEDKTILVWRSLNLDGTVWQVIWRAVQNPILNAHDALLDQAILSSLNQNLLTQRGAILTTLEYTNYYDSPFAKPVNSTKKKSLTLTTQGVSSHTTPIMPVPLQTRAIRSVTTSYHFETAVLRLVSALETAIQNARENLDNQAARTFMSTFLRATRKNTLQALQASPDNYGIPAQWVTWLTDAFNNDPILKTTLQNPHLNSSRFELELLQENLANLLQRYSVEETDEDEMDVQEQDDTLIETPTSTSSSSTSTTSNIATKKKGKCLVM